jgi:hypothetical protein
MPPARWSATLREPYIAQRDFPAAIDVIPERLAGRSAPEDAQSVRNGIGAPSIGPKRPIVRLLGY